MLKSFRLRLYVGAVTLFASQMGMGQEPPEYLEFDYSVYGERNTPTTGWTLRTMLPYDPDDCLNETTNTNNVNGNTRVSCDFWWEDYVGTNKHNGADFQVGPNGDKVPVLSFSYGRVCGARPIGTFAVGNGAYLSVEYLLNSGESVIANFLHLKSSSISDLFRNGLEETDCGVNDHLGYVTKLQRLANEGNTGTDATNNDAITHLHFEFSNKGGGSTFVPSDSSCPGDFCLSSQRNNKFDLDGLSSYFEFDSEIGNPPIKTIKDDLVWYNPDSVFKDKKILLPEFYVDNSFFSVFSYQSLPTMGVLDVARETIDESARLNITFIPLSYRDGFIGPTRAIRPRDHVYYANSADVERIYSFQNLTGKTYSSLKTIDKNDYYAFAEVCRGSENSICDIPDRTRGYPILFSVIDESEIIVDNDQSNSADTSISLVGESSKIPGYFLTSEIIAARPSTASSVVPTSVEWKPKRNGRFTVQVYIPDNHNTNVMTYEICPKSPNYCEFRTIDNSDFDHGWKYIIGVNGANEVYEFSNSGFIRLSNSIGNGGGFDLVADAVKFSYFQNEAEKISKKLNTENYPNTEHKILRHHMEGKRGAVVETGKSRDVSFTVESHRDREYGKYTLNGKSIYIDLVTHKVVNRFQAVSGPDWFGLKKGEVLEEGVIFDGGNE